MRQTSFRVRAKTQTQETTRFISGKLMFAILPCRVWWRLGPTLPLPDKPIANIILFGIKTSVSLTSAQRSNGKAE